MKEEYVEIIVDIILFDKEDAVICSGNGSDPVPSGNETDPLPFD